MKKLLIATVVAFISIATHAQTYTFGYDAAGNRTSRTLLLKAPGNNFNKSASTEASNLEKVQKENLGNITMALYPNPTQGEILLELKGLSENPEGLIQVFDMKGNRIHNQEQVLLKNTIDLRQHATGTYLLNIYIDGEVSQWKIVKE